VHEHDRDAAFLVGAERAELTLASNAERVAQGVLYLQWTSRLTTPSSTREW
jgi:hypothetical protein